MLHVTHYIIILVNHDLSLLVNEASNILKNSLLEENLKYLKKLNISSQPRTSDFN